MRRFAMDIAPGVRLDSYEILHRLAAGGMGEVWLARDVRLERTVAIKVLPAHLTENADHVARFRQEARAASALNHPNVCTIHSLGTAADGRLFIAMEYIDGCTLRARLTGEPLPVREAIDVAAQIAAGLAAAHSAGVIHRDVKPENVMIRSDGLVKVLDFGLAKLDPAFPSSYTAASTHMAATDDSVEGTIAYMSPEQAKGEVLDFRTDTFSLGAVLYEMVTGRAAFSGLSPAVVHDGILNRTPAPPTRVNPHVSARLEDTIMKALEKERSLRYQSVVELRTDLDRLTRDSDASPAGPGTRDRLESRRGRPQSWRLHWPARPTQERGASRTAGVRVGLAALLIALVAFGALRWGSLRSVLFRPELQEVQLTTNSSENPISSVAISPDGKYVAYADDTGIHLRAIDSGETHTISASDIGAINLVRWFPDGSKLLVSGGELQGGAPAIWSISIVGGTPQKLREDGLEASVSHDGSEITFVDAERKHVWRMGANGEEPHRVISAGESESLAMPAFLPADRLIGYARLRSAENTAGAVKLETSVESVDPQGHAVVLMSNPGLRGGVALPDGRFLYSLVAEPILDRDPSLWEARLDLQSGRLGGEWRIRDWPGQVVLWDFTSSADAKRVVFFKRSLQKDVYVADLLSDGSTANPRRFTLDDSSDFVTNWTDDSKALFFTSDRNGSYDIFRQRLDSRVAEAIVSGPDDESGPTAVTPDGRWLYYLVSPKNWRLEVKRGDAVFRTPAAGGAREKIADASHRHWTLCAKAPSTTCVLVEQDGTQLSIYALDSQNGKGRALTSTVLGGSWFSADLSPDGSRVAVRLPATSRIRVLSLNGDAPRDVVVTGRPLDPSAFYWSADGAGWYFSSTPDRYPEGTDLLHIDMNGAVKVVWHQNVRDPMAAIPSPDGHHIAVTAASTVSNAWMLKEF